MKIVTLPRSTLIQTVYSLDLIPFVRGEQEPLSLLLLRDMAALSDDSGHTSLELTRLSDGKGNIRALLVVRTQSQSKTTCTALHTAVCSSVENTLRQAYYLYSELDFNEYCAMMQAQGSTLYALSKADKKLPGSGIRGWAAPCYLETADWAKVDQLLKTIPAAVTITVAPSPVSPEVSHSLHRQLRHANLARGGPFPGMKDSGADEYIRALHHYSEETTLCRVGLTVRSSQGNVLAARVNSTLGCDFRLTKLSPCNIPLYLLPFALPDEVEKSQDFSFWTLDEASRALQLPCQGTSFTGIRANHRSLLRNTASLPPVYCVPTLHSATLGYTMEERPFFLPVEKLKNSTAVVGLAGKGKTTVILNLENQLEPLGVHCLTFELAKEDYPDCARVLTAEGTNPLRIDLFTPPPGVTCFALIGSILDAFKAALPMDEVILMLLEKALWKTFSKYGWGTNSKAGDPGCKPFGFQAFLQVFDEEISHQHYSDEVKGNLVAAARNRIESLPTRLPLTFGGGDTPMEDLLQGRVLLRLGGLDQERLLVVTAVLLTRMMAYFRAPGNHTSGSELKHLLVLDELHRVLDVPARTEQEKNLGASMENLLLNAITEFSAWGVGVLVADQTPSRLSSDPNTDKLLNNCQTKLVMGLNGSEGIRMARLLGTADDSLPIGLSLLERGEVLVSTADLPQPVLVKTMPPRKDFPRKKQLSPKTAQPVRMPLKPLLPSKEAPQLKRHSLCDLCSCPCTAAIHGRSVAASAVLLDRKKPQTPDQLVECIRMVPQCFPAKDLPAAERRHLWICTAIHLTRLHGKVYSTELNPQILKQLMDAYPKPFSLRRILHGRENQ